MRSWATCSNIRQTWRQAECLFKNAYGRVRWEISVLFGPNQPYIDTQALPSQHHHFSPGVSTHHRSTLVWKRGLIVWGDHDLASSGPQEINFNILWLEVTCGPCPSFFRADTLTLPMWHDLAKSSLVGFMLSLVKIMLLCLGHWPCLSACVVLLNDDLQ